MSIKPDAIFGYPGSSIEVPKIGYTTIYTNTDIMPGDTYCPYCEHPRERDYHEGCIELPYRYGMTIDHPKKEIRITKRYQPVV